MLFSKYETAQRSRLSKFAKSMLAKLATTSSLGLRLLQYFVCLRSVFTAAPVIHVAFDAVRIHGLSRMIGFMTLPGGMGGWLPPQALAP